MTLPSVFVSYSHRDEKWKDLLKPHLLMLEKADRLTIWDDRKIDAGDTWYDEIKNAMEDAEVAVCLISADYLASDFCVKEEIPYLLERRKNNGLVLIPILIRPCAWKAIDWLKAIQMLPRDGKSVAVNFKDDPDTPFTEVAEQILSLNTNVAFRRELGVVVEIPRWSPPEKVDVDRLPVTGQELFGRQKELKQLDEAWESEKINVISFVAYGGVGKSTLINKWREQMAAENYRGAKRVFAWSFYSQGTGDRVTSADLFIAEALKWFGDEEMANSPASPWDKGQRLADLVREQKTLLLLDGMEPLQSYFEFERGKIKDPALAVLVTELAKENPGLCVITTRENVIDLADFPDTTEQINFEQISPEAGRAILRVGGVRGTDAELEEAARNFGLHALALSLLAAYIHEIPGHHILNAKDIPDIDVPEKEGKHPRRVMAALERRFGDSAEVDVLRILGLFRGPAEKDEIAAVRAEPAIPNLTEHLQSISAVKWLQVVSKLRRLKLIQPESIHRPEALDAHPLVREHFGKQLKQECPEAWREGNNRLYEYYKAVAKEVPDTIEEMSPLYAAVMHGCQAGRYQITLDQVYYHRIQRDGNINYSMKRLGAIGADLAALSGFFSDTSWSEPIDELSEKDKGFILNVVGVRLRALGRLVEAVQPMQAALESRIREEIWMNAASISGNLSELYLALGEVRQALDYAEQSIEFADKSMNWAEQMKARTNIADILHQSGNFTKAVTMFHEAEERQKENQPQSSLLYSIYGFRYCSLLLSQRNYAAVEQRASHTLEEAKQHLGLLDVALDNLSLGCAYLIQAQHAQDDPFAKSLIYLNSAVDGLRRAGQQDYIPLGFLARAEYYRITNDFNRAKRDLDEAFTIASRGGMGLHLADCHLEYARLSLRARSAKQSPSNEGIAHLPRAQVPGSSGSALLAMTDQELKQKAREHWQIAKDSIEKMGYHRRDKEVQELEEQLR